MTYNEALKNLEFISEEIHKMRQEKRSNSIKTKSNSSEEKIIFQQQQPAQIIDTTDEYLDFPPKLTLKSNPIRPQRLSKHDCPHLLKDIQFRDSDFEKIPSQSTSNDFLCDETDDTEQWTEIRLSSNSCSTSSDYSPNSNDEKSSPDEQGGGNSSSNDEHLKIKCLISDDENGKKDGEGGLTTWITKSNVKSASRRQSLDILVDASDKVKDVFAQGFHKVGRSLERRNSESEANVEGNDFFSFR